MFEKQAIPRVIPALLNRSLNFLIRYMLKETCNTNPKANNQSSELILQIFFSNGKNVMNDLRNYLWEAKKNSW